MTEEIIKKLLEKQIPLEAIFEENPEDKRITWCGWQIVRSALKEYNDQWIFEECDIETSDKWNAINKCIKNNKDIALFFVDSEDKVYILCNENAKNTFELVGGFENYVKTMGD